MFNCLCPTKQHTSQVPGKFFVCDENWVIGPAYFSLELNYYDGWTHWVITTTGDSIFLSPNLGTIYFGVWSFYLGFKSNIYFATLVMKRWFPNITRDVITFYFFTDNTIFGLLLLIYPGAIAIAIAIVKYSQNDGLKIAGRYWWLSHAKTGPKEILVLPAQWSRFTKSSVE